MAPQSEHSYVKESENFRRDRLGPPRRVKFEPENEPMSGGDFTSIRSEREQAVAALLTTMQRSRYRGAKGRSGPFPIALPGRSIGSFRP
jgi:hypothetical protein